MAAARVASQERQPQLDAAKLVFIGETAASTTMIRRYGRAPLGQRLICKEPWGPWITVTFTGALRDNGVTAPMMPEGAMDGAAFLTYVETVLAPALTPGDIVILDNLPSHKGADIEEALAARGAGVRYLPPYSPNFNPIEPMFAKFKALPRKAAARTFADLDRVVAAIIAAISRPNASPASLTTGYATSS